MIKITLKILVVAFFVVGCSYHEATLINNVKEPAEVDLKKNGVLAFRLHVAHGTDAAFWVHNKDTDQKYQLDQSIDNGNSWWVGFGPITLVEGSDTNYNEIRDVYLYELPVGTYTVKDFNLYTKKFGQKMTTGGGFVPSDFQISENSVTYVGDIYVNADWGIFNTQTSFIVKDSSERIFETLNSVQKFDIQSFKKTSSVIDLKIN